MVYPVAEIQRKLALHDEGVYLGRDELLLMVRELLSSSRRNDMSRTVNFEDAYGREFGSHGKKKVSFPDCHEEPARIEFAAPLHREDFVRFQFSRATQLFRGQVMSLMYNGVMVATDTNGIDMFVNDTGEDPDPVNPTGEAGYGRGYARQHLVPGGKYTLVISRDPRKSTNSCGVIYTGLDGHEDETYVPGGGLTTFELNGRQYAVIELDDDPDD